MSTLRIAVDSSDAVRNTNAAKDALRGLGDQAKTTEGQVESSGAGMVRFALTLVGIQSATQVAAQAIRALFEGAKQLELGMVEISQKTGLTGPALDDLRDRVLAISATVPVSTQALFKFAEAAGQLQIRTPEGIEDFVRQIAVLQTIAPGIGGGVDGIGQSVGRFLRLVGEAPNAVQPLSDSIAELQDTFGATSAAIFDTGEAVARAGSGFIKSSADALGLGAALASLGIEGSQAGIAIAQTFSVVRQAASEGGRELETLKALTGLSGQGLQDALDANAADLFVRVLEGLGRQGSEAAESLETLGLAGFRFNRIVGPLIQNTDLLTRALDESREAQERGTDAANDAAQVTETLSGQLTISANLFMAAAGSATGLASGLADVVEVGNVVLRDLLGLGDAGQKAGAGMEAAAAGIEAAAIALGGVLVITRVTAAMEAARAAVAANNAAWLASQGILSGVTLQTSALSAVTKEAGAALLGFAATPLGAAVAVGGLVTGLGYLRERLDSIRTERARAEIADFKLGVEGLDRAAAGLSQARDIIFRAELNDDASAKLDGLRQRLAELGTASNAIAGELRRAVEPLVQEARLTVRTSIEGLAEPDVEQRAQAVLTASVQALRIPTLPPEKAADLQRSIEEAFDGIAPEARARLQDAVANAVASVTIPTVQLEALKVDELFPDVTGAGALFADSLAEAIRSARAQAEEEIRKLQELPSLDEERQRIVERIAQTGALRARAEREGLQGLAAQSVSTLQLKAEDVLPDALRQEIVARVEQFFGKDVGEKAQRVLTAAVEGLKLPGIDPAKSKQLTDSVNAALSLVSTGEVDASGMKALEAAFEEAGIPADELRKTINGVADAEGNITSDAVRLLAVVLQAAGIGAISAEKAMRALGAATAGTQLQVKAEEFKAPAGTASDFFQKESEKIQAAIREANLSIGRFYQQVEQRPGETTVEPPVELRGFEARRAALEAERVAYEKLLQTKLRAKDDKEKVKEEELPGLRKQADDLTAAKIGVLELAEEQRKLGVQQSLLSGQSSILGQQLQNLSLQAGGETAEAFDLLRRQIELTYQARTKQLQADLLGGGTPKGDIDALARQAQEQRKVALAGVDLQESLARTRELASGLGVQQERLAGQSSVLDQELRALSERGLGDSAEAFEILRQQIELTHQAAVTGIAARPIGPGFSIQDAQALKELADAQRDVSIEALRWQQAAADAGRASRQLGVEQDLLGRRSNVLGQVLQNLGRRGLGETEEAFALIRRQIELVRQQAQRDIEIRILTDSTLSQEQAEKLKRQLEGLAEAERELALEGAALDESNARNRRSFQELGNAAGEASRAITDSILGLRDPLEALNQMLLSIAANLIQPRVEAGILSLFGETGRGAADQQGVGDLLQQIQDFFGGETERQATEITRDIGIVPAVTEGRRIAGPVEQAAGGEGLAGILGTSGTDAATGLAAVGAAADATVTPMGSLTLVTEGARDKLAEFTIALIAATEAAQRAAAQAAGEEITGTATSIGGAIGGATSGGGGGGGEGGGGLDLPQQFTAAPPGGGGLSSPTQQPRQVAAPALIPQLGPDLSRFSPPRAPEQRPQPVPQPRDLGDRGGGLPRQTLVLNYNSNLTVNGGRSQLETGQKISMRQFERDVMSGAQRRLR